MELKLKSKEVELLLLAAIDREFPGRFNYVSLRSYGDCEFSWVEPERKIGKLDIEVEPINKVRAQGGQGGT